MTSLDKSTISFLSNCKHKSSKSSKHLRRGHKTARERTQRGFAGFFPMKGRHLLSSAGLNLGNSHEVKWDRPGKQGNVVNWLLCFPLPIFSNCFFSIDTLMPTSSPFASTPLEKLNRIWQPLIFYYKSRYTMLSNILDHELLNYLSLNVE